MGLFDSGYRKSSGDYAKERLKYLLVSDKTNCSKDVLEQLQINIFDVVSRYFEVDASHYEVFIKQNNMESDGEYPVLYVHVPIKNMKTKTIK